MSRLVVDASILIKLFINEPGSRQAAAAVKKKAGELLAPDLLWAEVGNALWKYVRRDELTPAEAQRLLADMTQTPIQLIAASDLVESALRLAIETDRTVYDCLYLSAAVHSNGVLLTADMRFANAMATTPWGKFVRSIGQ